MSLEKHNIKRDVYEMGGKIPPQNIEAEEAILGAMLLQIDKCDFVISMLTPECFYKDGHGLIYSSIIELVGEKKKVDIITVTSQLRKNGKLDVVGGPFRISQLTNSMAGAGNIDEHAALVYQSYMKREMISLGNEIVSKGYNDMEDVFDIHTTAQRYLDNLINFRAAIAPIGLGDLDTTLQQRNEKLLSLKGVSGVPCGLTLVDTITGGWQKTDLIILAARPGMGKTSLMLKYAVTPAKMGLGVIIFSLEMSRMQIFYRLASEETGIPLEKFIRKGLNHYEMEQYKAFAEASKSWNIIIDDTPSLSIQDMRLRVKQFSTKFSIDLVLSDYLQLHTYKGYQGTSRNDEVSKISGGLKSIAKEFDVPVIALSQLSRSVETRGGSKEPMLSDLRDSGSIEQDADMVQFLYRPEYYGITEDEKGNSLIGSAKIIIAKHRNGALDDAMVRFDGKTASFSNEAYFSVPAPTIISPSSGMTPSKDFDTNNITPF